MKRRMFLSLGVAGLTFGLPAFAQSFTDSVVSQLRNQGFGQISVERTLLGRTRVVAVGNGGQREIILNPRTGEILRDLWITGSGGSGAAAGGGLIDDDSGKGRDRGRDGDDRDDDDRDDDSNDDSDNDSDDDDDSDSNSGSGNSGGGDDSDDNT